MSLSWSKKTREVSRWWLNMRSLIEEISNKLINCIKSIVNNLLLQWCAMLVVSGYSNASLLHSLSLLCSIFTIIFIAIIEINGIFVVDVVKKEALNMCWIWRKELLNFFPFDSLYELLQKLQIMAIYNIHLDQKKERKCSKESSAPINIYINAKTWYKVLFYYSLLIYNI